MELRNYKEIARVGTGHRWTVGKGTTGKRERREGGYQGAGEDGKKSSHKESAQADGRKGRLGRGGRSGRRGQQGGAIVPGGAGAGAVGAAHGEGGSAATPPLAREHAGGSRRKQTQTPGRERAQSLRAGAATQMRTRQEVLLGPRGRDVGTRVVRVSHFYDTSWYQ